MMLGIELCLLDTSNCAALGGVQPVGILDMSSWMLR